MENTIECAVVMLPTDKRGVLFKGDIYTILDSRNGDRSYIVDRTTYPANGWHPQYLYFTDNSEIRKDDYYINLNDNTIYNLCTTVNGNGVKIISCTDPSLGLPVIPEAFIQKYVAAQGKIDKVRLERIKVIDPECPIAIAYWYELKLTAVNEVIVLDESDPILKSILRDAGEQSERRKYSKGYEPIEDKELEDAAYSYVKSECIPLDKAYASREEMGAIKKGFKEGAKWQKEQSAKRIEELEQFISDMEYRINH